MPDAAESKATIPASAFEQSAWLQRIDYSGPRAPTLSTLKALVAAHSLAISYESLDVLLGRPPKLDVDVLQDKMVRRRRGGYCFEQNMLFRAGLRSLGFDVTSLQARVVRGLPIDAPRPALHMVLRVDLPEGPYLADVGFGNLAPTSALALQPLVEQATPHETMRFITMGDELTLQSQLGDKWEHIYRVVPHPRFDAEYEIANWYTGSHPGQPLPQQYHCCPPGAGKDPTYPVQCPAEHPGRCRACREAPSGRRVRVLRGTRKALWCIPHRYRIAGSFGGCRGARSARRASSVLCMIALDLPSLTSIEFIAMPANPALNRTGRYAPSFLSPSARPAG
jgi:N-hydroxyarylamine O-acetyltransferase